MPDEQEKADDTRGISSASTASNHNSSDRSTFQREGHFGSNSADDSGQPQWDWSTKWERLHDYDDGDGKYLYTLHIGRTPDGEKVVTKGRLIRGNDLQIQKAEHPHDFFKYEGLTNYKKGSGNPSPVLYRQHQLLREMAERPDDIIIICEGEKDVDRVWELGGLATCNPDGALKWNSLFGRHFLHRSVAITPDNDPRGVQHAKKVAASVNHYAASVVIVDLSLSKVNGDLSDYFDAGHTLADLIGLAKKPPEPTAVRGNRDDEEISQVTMANIWARNHARNRRYNHTGGHWMHVDAGGIWQQEECRETFHEIGTVIHEVGGGTPRYSCSGFITGTENIARSLPAVAVTHDYFDADKMMLGTPLGPVDLRTGKLLPPNPALLISRSTSVAPSPGEPSKWIAFLMQSTGQDALMVEYLQVVLGYMLTGLTIEQALFFIYGDGGNGKGVFINTARRILGKYAVTSAMETFTASRNEQHPTGLAMLKGARMVTASETEQGRPWAESRIKQLTGSDEISARYMRQDFFSFVPEFKLLIIGNFHPVLHTVDDAMKRRFNIIPFTRKPDVVNRKLEEELEEEFPQILQWMIDGCLKWQRTGLRRPEAVDQATADYFEDQDVFGRWLEEYCLTDDAYKANTNDLFHNWSMFADDVKEEAGTVKGFAGMMTKRGFRPGREKSGKRLRYWNGLKLQMIADGGKERAKTPRDNMGEAL